MAGRLNSEHPGGHDVAELGVLLLGLKLGEGRRSRHARQALDASEPGRAAVAHARAAAADGERQKRDGIRSALMLVPAWRFATLLLTALNLGMAFAHVLELPTRRR